MKAISSTIILVLVASTNAFTLQPIHHHYGPSVKIRDDENHVRLSLSQNSHEYEKSSPQVQTANISWSNHLGKMLTTGLLTASLWAAPTALVQNQVIYSNIIINNNLVGTEIVSSSVANAKQMASATGSRVNKDPESLLRYGLPIDSKEVQYSCHHHNTAGNDHGLVVILAKDQKYLAKTQRSSH